MLQKFYLNVLEKPTKKTVKEEENRVGMDRKRRKRL